MLCLERSAFYDGEVREVEEAAPKRSGPLLAAQRIKAVRRAKTRFFVAGPPVTVFL